MNQKHNWISILISYFVVCVLSGCSSSDPCKPGTEGCQILLVHPNETTSYYHTIQAAIDAADSLDIIRISDGIYSGAGNYNLDYKGKAITIYSASGNPNNCIIDCQDLGRAFQFYGSEGPASILDGITIINGMKLSDEEPKLARIIHECLFQRIEISLQVGA
jgi:pectin methylesterase-like acyl-CoA thioesterase